MNTWIKVARYHLLDPLAYLVGPWAVLAVVFLINVVITVAQGGPNPTKSLAVMYLYFFALGILSIGRALPFGLALGVSRRSYYTGTALLVVGLAAVDGLALTVLQAVERASGGWGMQLHFFQISSILSGPWYLTWLTSSVALAAVYVYGTCYGLIRRRWRRYGLLYFILIQIALIRGGIALGSGSHAWTAFGHFFGTLTAVEMTGMLAAMLGILLLTGFSLIRRVSV
ncbi:MAG: ABC transporter permease [Candidatus Dormiibacterota bacterium]